MSTDVLRVFYFSPRWLPENQFSVMFSQVMWWGGWGSNPRPADYKNYGPVHRTHYLHGYHGAEPPMALIALLAQVTRSTNRSTPTMAITECQLQNVTAARPASMSARGGIRPPVSAGA
jgi:hypothetical protein